MSCEVKLFNQFYINIVSKVIHGKYIKHIKLKMSNAIFVIGGELQTYSVRKNYFNNKTI